MSEPRTWETNIPPEPTDVTAIVDRDGDVWVPAGSDDEGGMWEIPGRGGPWSRWVDLFEWQPLTEVIEP